MDARRMSFEVSSTIFETLFHAAAKGAGASNREQGNDFAWRNVDAGVDSATGRARAETFPDMSHLQAGFFLREQLGVSNGASRGSSRRRPEG